MTLDAPVSAVPPQVLRVVRTSDVEPLLADVQGAIAALEQELLGLEQRIGEIRRTAIDVQPDPIGASLLRLADELRREVAVEAERLVVDARARAEAIVAEAGGAPQPPLRLA